jgi:hypothetical protein
LSETIRVAARKSAKVFTGWIFSKRIPGVLRSGAHFELTPAGPLPGVRTKAGTADQRSNLGTPIATRTYDALQQRYRACQAGGFAILADQLLPEQWHFTESLPSLLRTPAARLAKIGKPTRSARALSHCKITFRTSFTGTCRAPIVESPDQREIEFDYTWQSRSW